MIQAHVKTQNPSQLFHCSLTSSIRSSHKSNHSLFSRIALLSNQQQWLLFTAETPRPEASQLRKHNVCCERVIHMKPSQVCSEAEIVKRAILSRNASAIVASNNISQFEQAQLVKLATQYQCEVFFVSSEQDRIH
ncbi:MAG: hypothetical protein ACPG5L_14445 [Vibrio gallaecicus]|uniref:50S ribosomal protein L7ae n=1 Tax=Vibrio gallaecicus TaxID=552386 RepID=A0ABV4NCT7_9VIBR|nr:hypothetical protein [Vibrio gallaecicus]MDN3613851.1 hypothetical protein [Vibrio gallaecicus]